VKRKPIALSPSVEQMVGDAAGRYQSQGRGHGQGQAYFIELTRLGTMELPFGDAYLWIICETAGGYFSKTDYLSRATFFASQERAREFLEVFTFVQGRVVAGQPPERRSSANSFERSVLFHLWLHNVFNHFPQGALTWKTQLSGLLQEKSPASDLPSTSTASNSPTASKCASKPLPASSLPEPSDCQLQFPF
jgi:hypothetical protein